MSDGSNDQRRGDYAIALLNGAFTSLVAIDLDDLPPALRTAVRSARNQISAAVQKQSRICRSDDRD